MVVQRDLKRLLAYSSIEHMGIIAVGIGLGGPLGLYGALLHAFNHSIAKTMLFFTAGNVRENFSTLRMERIRGMARLLPWTSGALVVGTLAIVGMPPFALFISEFFILSAAFSTAHYAIAVLVLISLSVVFGALLYHFQGMLSGESQTRPAHPRPLATEFATVGVCAVALVALGIRVPQALTNLLHVATGVLQ